MTQTIDFFFDPVCPYCWMTSRWVRQVQRLDDLDVGWRFISLAILNEATVNEESERAHRPGHAIGLRLLRVADAVGDHAGNQAVGEFYREVGSRLWEEVPEDMDGPPPPDEQRAVITAHQSAVADDLPAILGALGLPGELAEAADDEGRDTVLRSSTELAMDRTGGDVGTPVITFEPPDGPSFFGPVISRLGTDDEAVELWGAVSTLARWSTFSEIKRTRRVRPHTRLLQAVRGS